MIILNPGHQNPSLLIQNPQPCPPKPQSLSIDNPYPFPQNPKTVSENESATLKDGLDSYIIWLSSDNQKDQYP